MFIETQKQPSAEKRLSMNFIQQFMMSHPGWGLAYFLVVALFVLMLVQILVGKKKED